MDDDLRAAFVAWEKEMAAYWDAALRNPDFLQAMWQLVELNLKMRQTVGQQFQQPMTPVSPANLLAEIGHLQQLTNGLEQRLDSLLADIADG